ncbi:hypothetical protein NL108_006129 [Boleophthalmus pectinirostris]|nr:hypothetical protein NL108_006129 [Boleophthalmus pectinirostris]
MILVKVYGVKKKKKHSGVLPVLPNDITRYNRVCHGSCFVIVVLAYFGVYFSCRAVCLWCFILTFVLSASSSEFCFLSVDFLPHSNVLHLYPCSYIEDLRVMWQSCDLIFWRPYWRSRLGLSRMMLFSL